MFDIIIIAMVALFVFLRLKSELGNRNDEDLPSMGSHRDNAGAQSAPAAKAPTALPREASTVFNATLLKIQNIDHGFSAETFMDNATQAYQMILEAFWSNDTATLESFLSPEVFKQFDGAIKTRKAAKQTLENKILDVLDRSMTKVSLVRAKAKITLQFTTDLIAVTRDKDNVAIQGDISNAVEVVDTWTFARDLKSHDPKWLLVATHAGTAPEPLA